MNNNIKKEYYGEPNVFQSKIWAQFQVSLDRKTWRIQTKEFTGLVVKYPLFLGKSYLYVPRGPLTSSPIGLQTFNNFVEAIKELTKKENAAFVRIEPPTEEKINITQIKKAAFLKVTKNSPLGSQVSPAETLILDLRLTEDQILSQMKPKGRYNIRVAKKNGVIIRESTVAKDVDIFLNLLRELESRGQYSGHNDDYYRKLVTTLIKERSGKMFIAYFNKEPINAIIVSHYGKTATYIHGASSNNNREVMAPYLTQWEAICDAKNKGCHIYDFWGIASKDDANHHWKGITEFKLKFGGEKIKTIGSFDRPLQKFWYGVFKSINTVRKIGK